MSLDPSQSGNSDGVSERVVLVTGTLAEPAVRRVAEQVSRQCGVRCDVHVLNIQVAALMTGQWMMGKLRLDEDDTPDRVIVPGYCRGEFGLLAKTLGVQIERGPNDVRDLPLIFEGGRVTDDAEYGQHDIEIIAEINDAARLPVQQIIDQAQKLSADGADVIDVGCDPHADRSAWSSIGGVVKELCARGHRVSVDSFHPVEVGIACAAGAELVLSVNASNCETASDWGAEVVVIPDDPRDPRYLVNLEHTVGRLHKDGVKFRIDPVIEPIGFGFSASLARYLEVRQKFPDAAMLMGIANITELTGADSAGINALLIGFCQEIKIRSVLTTEVINWAQSSVREISVARRMMHFAVTNRILPKDIKEALVMLRDKRLHSHDKDEFAGLAAKLTDKNIRIYADVMRCKLHAMSMKHHVTGDDPFLVFDELEINDPSHAFYLGYEMAKAMTAITLGKNYIQDEALDWGFLTRDEVGHYERRSRKSK